MKRLNILQRCLNSGVVAVVRGNSTEESYNTAIACIEGGVTSIELAFTAPHADQTISKLADKYSKNTAVVIGAGTVLDAPTARLAILSGAEFIVSSSFNNEVAEICNLYQIPYMPGCQTPKEIQTALTAGVDIIKVFPAKIVGMGFFDAIKKGPLPHTNLMPTGGVNLDNMAEWFNHGAVLVGAGGNLTSPAATGNFAEVTKLAVQYHAEWETIKKTITQ
ncbi:bifunctional 2-keto-4-hydroxyglutarate aldolase/2-keto-3-deoxy-6-phosphogluconate aldolase [Secundilactobacillus collinoides]|uniref:2-dehydro-3-deoxyphosphogluconate aldolase 4-hydroxy-2-oxoglutarate aldolase n=2 Tax=Secundilactobacillus collinoides TaxID=33960 RepID=A0A0R2B682_SECCO|nr:bifunctional 2-keto-4-hydroxyglutarate aldolase/2-keto-3-deoxy-6-phosphogluconate aldolase [Secundilactobacillus collinoides]KRM74872.1 2-dehydro-3-deoxyphosphogluconate aldolase 4-hydroxy-2-oxoglutarate aldolase [Secundilactobacillus collinoides DSM 20515 = JCM 1123]KZL39368.1 ketohydroxyglutarate aldolase [Secundilactobacillus collinoides]